MIISGILSVISIVLQVTGQLAQNMGR
jgi:hypothetical protein